MKRLMSSLVSVALLTSQSVYCSDNFPKEDNEESSFERSRIKFPICRYPYVPSSKYWYVGDDKERDVALYRKENNETFFQRLGKVLWGSNVSSKVKEDK